MPKTLQENLARQLCDSVDRLQKQVEKVEFWASAVTGLTQPVPDYEPETTAVARYREARTAAAEAPPSPRRATRTTSERESTKPASA